MKTEHKKFKPFDRVLVRGVGETWRADIYSHWDENYCSHTNVAHFNIPDRLILPYEGNEHLLGTTDDPEEEIELEIGDWLFGANNHHRYLIGWRLFQFACVDDVDSRFKERFGEDRYFDYVIRFSDFNPNDIKETMKHILCVKNGKVARYKPE